MSLGLGVTIAGILLHMSQSLHGQPELAWNDFWPAFLIVGVSPDEPRSWGSERVGEARRLVKAGIAQVRAADRDAPRAQVGSISPSENFQQTAASACGGLRRDAPPPITA